MNNLDVVNDINNSVAYLFSKASPPDIHGYSYTYEGDMIWTCRCKTYQDGVELKIKLEGLDVSVFTTEDTVLESEKQSLTDMSVYLVNWLSDSRDKNIKTDRGIH
jgi:hypothetical protein